MKYIRLIAVACLLAIMLAACANTNTPTTTEPVTTPSTSNPPSTSSTPPTSTTLPQETCKSTSGWHVDKDNHWRICDDHGEIIDLQPHSVENEECATCNSMIKVVEGCTYLRKLDHFGVIVLDISYDENGNVLTKDSWDVRYDINGNIIEETYYEMDVKKTTMRYSATGVLLADITYAPDGTIAESKRYEYSYDARGLLIGQKNLVNEEIVYEISYQYFGSERHTLVETKYDENRTKTSTHYFYDKFGKLTNGEVYVNDVLTFKHEYQVVTSQGGIFTQEIIVAVKTYEFNPNGGYTLTDYTLVPNGYTVSVFNEAEEEISREYYYRDGNPYSRPSEYDAVTCAPLFGTWEGTYTLTAADMGVTMEDNPSIQLHVSMKFDKFGGLSMKWTVDKNAYYSFLVSVEEERLLQEKMATGMTRNEAMDFYYSQGTSALDIAIANVGSVEDHVPGGFYFYYLNNGVLHYTMEGTTTSVSVVIADKTLTLCGANNQKDLVLSKKE